MAGRKMAYIYDVILSYIFELNLDLLLDTPKTTLIAATTKVITYLKEARDPNIDESIAYYDAASRPVYEALLAEEAKLDREDLFAQPSSKKWKMRGALSNARMIFFTSSQAHWREETCNGRYKVEMSVIASPTTTLTVQLLYEANQKVGLCQQRHISSKC